MQVEVRSKFSGVNNDVSCAQFPKSVNEYRNGSIQFSIPLND